MWCFANKNYEVILAGECAGIPIFMKVQAKEQSAFIHGDTAKCGLLVFGKVC